MSNIWPAVTKNQPCIICGKPDWCCTGDRGSKCMRIASPFPFKNGGWFHPFQGDVKIERPAPRPKEPELNAPAMMRTFSKNTFTPAMGLLAENLGVSLNSLEAFGCVWAGVHLAWAFPMRDGYGEIIGIRLRANDGRKWAVRGSRQGIFYNPQIQTCPKVFITEGPTDVAAGLTIGLPTIGRPSCQGGGDQIKTLLNRIGVRMAVIVADNDGPGTAGAIKLQSELGVKTCLWTPPAKDLREFVRLGGTSQVVESELMGIVWSNH
jgi:hypothetical protein